ncbi:Cytochrome c oxidase assembly factor 6 homolog [Caenorhabditis elegans]|uniref:Cytochrome c oxidase assembly factor 6 homolog n=1 Tax=Caenorhabditis elegans TaxID=6239 RepID=A5JYU1_CAEEL|nr:Cytochrome c oxidase assembly factor 6 homolog [Caenorhabditis elegans]CAN86912.1 Cytochrome c oxidase assembly factor 6 homolog [Caenorhabditis elegans]|eukprot:NP_001122564.1 Cytochrome Oxidase Assembly subunits [Caenorhabditis elegans]
MSKEEPSLKSERRKCYEARDQYAACIDKFLSQGKSEKEATNSCRSERKNFDGNCPTSWVNHFIRKDQFERYKKTLAAQGVNIADHNALND